MLYARDFQCGSPVRCTFVFESVVRFSLVVAERRVDACSLASCLRSAVGLCVVVIRYGSTRRVDARSLTLR